MKAHSEQFNDDESDENTANGAGGGDPWLGGLSDGDSSNQSPRRSVRLSNRRRSTRRTAGSSGVSSPERDLKIRLKVPKNLNITPDEATADSNLEKKKILESVDDVMPPDMDDSGMDISSMYAEQEEAPKKINKSVVSRNNMADDIRLIQQNDTSRIVLHARELIRRWIIPTDEVLSDMERSMKLCANFKLEMNNLDSEMLELAYEDLISDIERHLVEIRRLKHIVGLEIATELETELYKVMKVCQATNDCLTAILQQKIRSNGSSRPGVAYLLPTIAPSTLNPKQEFTIELYKITSAKGYRICNKMLYEPVVTKYGQSTHAYKEKMEVSAFVASMCNRRLNESNWQFITSGRGTSANVADVAATLETIRDHELPELVRDRFKFSFSNGIFLIRLERKTGLATDTPKTKGSQFYSRFIPYNHPDFRLINEEKASAKYFQQPMTEYPDDLDFMRIPTPTLQHIMNYQFGGRPDSEEIFREMYFDIGRLLYEMGDLDNWQYAIYFKGIGGTGKSTIIEYILKHIYYRENVAEINNNIEPQFGIGGLLKNRIVYLTTFGEVNEKCQLELPTVLNIISGGEVIGAVKNQVSAISLEHWPGHSVFAGNGFPNTWVDTADQVGRRFKMYPFMRKVLKKDLMPDLKDRLVDELPNIIQKCVRAYLEKVNKYSIKENRDMWYCCPKFFLESRVALKKMTNHLQSFMTDSAYVVVDSKMLVSEEDLLNDFKAFAKSKNVSSTIKTKDISFQAIIQELNDDLDVKIEYKLMPVQMYEGQLVYSSYFFFGLGLTSKMTEAQRKKYHEKTNPVESKDGGNNNNNEESEEYIESSDYDDVFEHPPVDYNLVE